MGTKIDCSARVRDLAHRLIGSTGMGELLDEMEELSIPELRALDILAMRCECCDWWVARHEIVDDGVKYVCQECKRDGDDVA